MASSKSSDGMKTFTLNLHDRIILLNTLPKEGDVITVKVVRDLKADLGLSEKEIETVGIKTLQGGRIEWDKSKEVPKEISIGPAARGVIKATLDELNSKKKLTEDHLNLWDVFC